MSKYDFSGYVTRYGVRCTDGRTIVKDAFADCNGKTVPLVWNHNHDEVSNTLGKITLETRPDGVYGYGSFNDTMNGQDAKMMVQHGDISNLSIYANHLKQMTTSPTTKDVLSGKIKEVSLVLSGANPEAFIDTPILSHGDDGYEYCEGEIYLGEINEFIEHADTPDKEESVTEDENNKDKKTVREVYEGMDDEEKLFVALMVQQALKGEAAVAQSDADDDEENYDDIEGGNDMKHSAFAELSARNDEVLKHHAESLKKDFNAILSDPKKKANISSFRDFFNDVIAQDEYMSHADGDEDTQTYGVINADYLFPDAKAIMNEPEFIKRDTTWVGKFFNGATHSPFSRFKVLLADVREDAARAKGYITGTQKYSEVFPLLTRSITPQTVYKLQEMDRDTILDIKDLNMMAWLKAEMRMMLDEEVARAGLVGDGRLVDDPYKISEEHIKPVYSDNDLYSIKVPVETTANMSDANKAKAFIKACIKARKNYKGSGSPTLFCTADILTEMLLLEDGVGRPLYDTVDKLATKLRVTEIVECEVMENMSRTSNGSTYDLAGIILNPKDYKYGTDKGGEVTMFEDFDIHFNRHEALLETRCSGMLTKPFSAMVVEFKSTTSGGGESST